jgi:hypothetical protein
MNEDRVYVTRAEFEEFFGVRTDSSDLGALLVSHDGDKILLEYLFLGQEEEIKFLENLYAMSEG